MLQNIPSPIGHALSRFRSGLTNVACHSAGLAELPETIAFGSPAFPDGTAMPTRYTADGEGHSPPLEWSGVPDTAAALMILIEDADAPTPRPLVHGIVAELPGIDGQLPEDELSGSKLSGSRRSESSGRLLGKNSFLRAEYLPPDPPPGHGAHRYVFQIYAVSRRPHFSHAPGRSQVIERVRLYGIAKGVFTGTYGRH
jgi:Raf kinase inhibitor-like YbhB/YbcL family protein